MEMNNNQQNKKRINRQTCGFSFLDLVIFELRAAIFTQSQNFFKSWFLYYQFTQSCKFLLESINSLESYSIKCVFPWFSESHTIYDQHPKTDETYSVGDRHVGESLMLFFFDYDDGEVGFHCRFVETWESFSCCCCLEMCSGQITIKREK